MATRLNEPLTDELRATLHGPRHLGSGRTLSAVLNERHPADIAEALRNLPPSDVLTVFSQLDDGRAARVLGDLGPETTRYLLDHTSPERIAALVVRLPMDDATWVVSRASSERAETILIELSARAPVAAADVRALLGYGERTAGRLMTRKFVRLDAAVTVEEAFATLRRADREVETLTDLVAARPAQRLAEIMTPDPITVSVETNQEEVARLLSKYDFLALPVVNRQGALVGIVTVDDIVDVLVEEHTEDQLKFGAVEPGVVNQPYFATPLLRIVRSRVGWLVLLFVAETATGSVLRYFEHDLEKVVALSFFVPLLIGTGGNTGAQTVSTIIRGLALREVRLRDTQRVLARELASGVSLGLLLGVVAFVRAMLWGSGLQLSLVVALTILAIVTWANLIGAVIPLTAQRLKIDPALVSAPLITTLVDATGLVIYFLIANALLTALR